MITSTGIKNMEVIDRKANVIGRVEDIAINTDTLKVDYFIVILDKETMSRFNIKKKLFGQGKKITILASEVDSIGDKILLNKTLAEILDVYESTQEEVVE